MQQGNGKIRQHDQGSQGRKDKSNLLESFKGRLDNGVQVTAMQLSSMVDERYITVGAHIDINIREKIKRGEYVDFA